MIESAFEALVLLFTVERMSFLLLGVFMGLVVGIIPGLSGTSGMALLLPFIFGMEPVAGIALMIGMVSVTHTSDTFPSILLGVPGSSGSQATIMDGYPLAQQGEAQRALAAAFIVSMVGGIFGALVLFGILGVARPVILALASPELFMFALLGLSMVGVLSRGSALAGILSGFLGLILGVVGPAPGTPVYRFTFDTFYLMGTIPLASLALGLFAFPELVDLLSQRTKISRVAMKLGGGRRKGLQDASENRWLVLRTSAIGAAVGFVPGLGGAVTDWIAYGATKSSVKDSSRFGQGDIRGVIGPESANNAKEGGTLIPTLLFGIPGSGSMAMLLGGLLLMGIQTGPNMLAANLHITLSIVWTLLLASILATSLCLALSGVVARVTDLPADRLVPVLLVMIFLSSYQNNKHWGDVLVLLIIGLVGWVMKQSGWPRAPLLIGFVLSTPAERYLQISMSRYGFAWLMRPIVIGIIIVIVVVLVLALRSGTTPGAPTALLGADGRETRDGDGETLERERAVRPTDVAEDRSEEER